MRITAIGFGKKHIWTFGKDQLLSISRPTSVGSKQISQAADGAGRQR